MSKPEKEPDKEPEKEPELIDHAGIIISSGYGARTETPYVQMLSHKSDWMIQIPALQTIQLSVQLMRAAEASLTDAFLLHYAMNIVGTNLQDAGVLLVQMREFREQFYPTPVGLADLVNLENNLGRSQAEDLGL